MSITIPSSFLPPSSPQGPAVNATLPHGTSVGEGVDVPSETNLLMAAAEMHRMGRLPKAWGNLQEPMPVNRYGADFLTLPASSRDKGQSTSSKSPGAKYNLEGDWKAR